MGASTGDTGMIRRWCIYLAALGCGIGLFVAVSAWVTWILLLAVASLPLFSVLVRIIGKGEAEQDSLGLFRFPVDKRPVEYAQVLRPYQIGDSLGRVLWKLTAKTGVLTLREERILPKNVPTQRRWAVITVGLCLSVVFFLFPPWKYERQMQFLQSLLLRSYSQEIDVCVDLAAVGPLAESRQAVLDVVASEAQMLYLRGQAFDIYDGGSWRSSDTKDGNWPACGLEGAATVTIATRITQAYRYFPYYIAGEECTLARGALENRGHLQEYTYRQQRFVGAGQTVAPPEQCLQLPEETKKWAEGIVLELFAEEKLTETEKIEKIQSFVRNCGKYDKKTAPMPEEEVDFARWFLENERGYCVHFATTAVVLLRCAGIPARLVTGYAVQVHAGVRKTVVGSDAHAWVEYLQGGFWRILEPTPDMEAVPPAEVPQFAPEKESNLINPLFWMLAGMIIALAQALHWKIVHLMGENVSQLKALAQKSAFSREGLALEEKQMLDDWLAQAKPLLRLAYWCALRIK